MYAQFSACLIYGSLPMTHPPTHTHTRPHTHVHIHKKRASTCILHTPTVDLLNASPSSDLSMRSQPYLTARGHFQEEDVGTTIQTLTNLAPGI